MNQLRTARLEDWIQNPVWISIPRLAHGTLTRQEAVTEGKLPMSESVGRARPFIGRLLAQPKKSADVAQRATVIVGADQIHGDSIAVVREADDLQSARRLPGIPEAPYDVLEFPESDALITSLPGILLVIQTADCLPILFHDVATGLIGACHCGWRGLYAGLARKTAREMIALGSRAHALQAWLGPAIRTANYEVGNELVEKFQKQFPGTRVSPNGTHLDLSEIARQELLRAGLLESNVSDSRACTFADRELYHSYRRDGPGAGRLLTVIGRFD